MNTVATVVLLYLVCGLATMLVMERHLGAIAECEEWLARAIGVAVVVGLWWMVVALLLFDEDMQATWRRGRCATTNESTAGASAPSTGARPTSTNDICAGSGSRG